MQRFEARRRYRELQDALNETLDQLFFISDHDQRASLLDSASNTVAELAELHTDAWGSDTDAAGLTMADALTYQAALLCNVADTERAVICSITWPSLSNAELTGRHAAELRTWTELAHTAAPGRRAQVLRRLRVLITAHFGERAAEVLAVLAETEQHLATGHHRPETPRLYRFPRILIAVVLGLLGLIAVVPGLDAADRAVLLVTVLAGAHIGLNVYGRIRDRRETDR
jgi:hypothetical protein